MTIFFRVVNFALRWVILRCRFGILKWKFAATSGLYPLLCTLTAEFPVIFA
jgi:hypothetical protein